jgi:hypothetical protein
MAKNADKSLDILMTTGKGVQSGVYCPIDHIPSFARSHWMPPSGKCLRRIAPVAAMVDKFVAKHKTLPKHSF